MQRLVGSEQSKPLVDLLTKVDRAMAVVRVCGKIQPPPTSQELAKVHSEAEGVDLRLSIGLLKSIFCKKAENLVDNKNYNGSVEMVSKAIEQSAGRQPVEREGLASDVLSVIMKAIFPHKEDGKRVEAEARDFISRPERSCYAP